MNKVLSILLFSLSVLKPCAQTDSVRVLPARPFNQTTGMIAYYFWEEDSTGAIVPSTFGKPFLQNYIVSANGERAFPEHLKAEELRHAIVLLTHNPKWDRENHYFLYRLFHAADRRIVSALERTEATSPASIVFRKSTGGWQPENQRRVLYFTVDADNRRRFSHSSDSLVVPSLHTAMRSNNLYEVVTFHRSGGDSARVFAYNGADLTDSIAKHGTAKPIRMLLLVNGYRGPTKDNDPGDGLITQKDRYYYWYKIDDRFREALQPDVMLFMDGSFPISTSNHRTKLRFGLSWLRTMLTPKNKATDRVYRRLNTKTNPEGFRFREERGRIAAQALLLARCLPPGSDTVKDTLDIVCHSMGYACALGLLDVVKDDFVLGNIYIMAPENAGAEGFDWQLFEQAWQYGSNCEPTGREPLRAQDGIAPQCGVKNLENVSPSRGGRIYFPPDWPDRNFVDSHMVYSYDWMFDCIPEGEPGYIHR